MRARGIAMGSQEYEAIAHGLVREALLHARVRCPSVVHMYGVVQDSDDTGTNAVRWMVMELANGGSLAHWLQNEVRQRQGIDLRTFMRIADDALRGIAELHQLRPPVAHRDVKALNYLVFENEGGGMSVKLSDFGLACELVLDVSGVPMRRRSNVGTPLYKAPEVGTSDYDALKIDIYSYGVMMAEIVVTSLRGSPRPFVASASETFRGKRKLLVDEASSRLKAMQASLMAKLIETCGANEPARRPDADTVRGLLRAAKLEAQALAPAPLTILGGGDGSTPMLSPSGSTTAQGTPASGIRAPAESPHTPSGPGNASSGVSERLFTLHELGNALMAEKFSDDQIDDLCDDLPEAGLTLDRIKEVLKAGGLKLSARVKVTERLMGAQKAAPTSDASQNSTPIVATPVRCFSATPVFPTSLVCVLTVVCFRCHKQLLLRLSPRLSLHLSLHLRLRLRLHLLPRYCTHITSLQL